MHNAMNKKLAIATLLIAGIVLAAPTVLGAIIRLERLAFGSFPAASALNEGGLLYDTDADHPKFSNSSGWRQLVALEDLETTAALTLYVDTAGSDSNACTASGASACLTVQGALGKIPKRIKHPVTINIASGTFDGFRIEGFYLDAATTTGAYLVVQGTRVTSTLASGATSGTFTSGSAGTCNTGVWGGASLAAAGWTVSDLKGRYVNITGGTGAGQIRVIADNTATTITVAGCWTAPDATSTFVIQDSATLVNTDATLPAIPDLAATAEAKVLVINLVHGRGIITSPNTAALVISDIRFTTGGARSLDVYSPGTAVRLLRCRHDSGTGTLRNRTRGNFVYNVDNNYFSMAGVSMFNGASSSMSFRLLNSVVDSTTAFLIAVPSMNIEVIETQFIITTGTVLAEVGRDNARINFTGVNLDCGGSAGSLIRSNTTTIPDGMLQTIISGTNAANCGSVFRLKGPNILQLTNVTGSGNTTVLELDGGPLIEIFSNVIISGATEIDLDGTAYTFANVRAAVPKRITDALTHTSVYEQ